MRDTKFMTAADKEKVLHQWEVFLRSGLSREKFTKSLYHHLIQHCSFIAHYDQNGFYSTYFECGDMIAQFLSQFDERQAESNGIPKCVEYGMTYWVSGDYEDINRAMIEIASKYIPNLLAGAQARQKEADVAMAEALLAKHGLKVG